MYTGWNWRDKWYSIFDLQGDAWNKISFQIPEDVKNSQIIETGLVCTIQNVSIGQSSIYIDDIYFNKKSPTAINEQDNNLADIPDDFKLFNNYPNPFNPETKIMFNLPKSTKVRITVYDIVGRQVKSLVNDNKTAGSYAVIFNGNELTSGVYLYSLEAGAYKEVKKMLLLK